MSRIASRLAAAEARIGTDGVCSCVPGFVRIVRGEAIDTRPRTGEDETGGARRKAEAGPERCPKCGGVPVLVVNIQEQKGCRPCNMSSDS